MAIVERLQSGARQARVAYMPQVFDIVILGGTPAGYAAANALARKGRTVCVVESPGQPAESPLIDWVPREFFSAGTLPKSLEKKAGAKPFKHVIYHNLELVRQVEYTTRGSIGYFLNVGDLTRTIKAQAVKAGVKVRVMPLSPRIDLQEDQVRLMTPSPTIGRILLVAQNTPGDIISELSLPAQSLPQPPMVVAALDVPVGPSARSMAGVLHIVETRDRTDLGMFMLAGGCLHIRLISASVASGTRAEELSTMVSKLQRASAVPADLPFNKATGAIWYPPAGLALELESHVAKRCMLIGTAGGFAESITGQTLYPSVKSALIAADIAHSALDHAKTQEELMRYKTHWRKNLADYLRPPNTSLQMLLPLLFVNQQIVAKFTRALLFGDPI